MAFSRDDLKAYEAQLQTQDPNHDPWGKSGKVLDADPQAKAEASSESSAEPVAESPVEDIDGSTTETQEAEPVAAESDSPEVDKDPDNDEPADGRPRNRAQERISELVDERNAVKDYNKYLQGKLDEALRMLQGKQNPVAQDSSPEPVSQTESKDDPAPTLETAEYDPIKFNKLQNEWIQRQVNKQVKAAVQQIETRQSENAVRVAFENRVAEFRKTAPDFDVVIANPQLPQLAPAAAGILVRSENGPAVAYHLAKNPDVAVRIAKMDAVSQAAAIGRLEEQLVRATASAKEATAEPSKAKAPVAKVTKAPPPPKPVSGGSAPVSKDPSQMTMEEWVAHERGRKVAERKAKQALRSGMR